MSEVEELKARVEKLEAEISEMATYAEAADRALMAHVQWLIARQQNPRLGAPNVSFPAGLSERFANMLRRVFSGR